MHTCTTMFIEVKLLNGFPETLLYKVPEHWPHTDLKAALVSVPLKNRVEIGWVTNLFQTKPNSATFAIKDALSIESFPSDQNYLSFITKLGRYYCIDTIYFIKRIRQFIAQKEITIDSPPFDQKHHQQHMLTDEQQSVYDFISNYIEQSAYKPALLHGVTGSGKTEVYKKLIIKAIEQQKTALLLLPEVTLAIQFEHIMRTQLPDSITVCGFHSGSSASQKKLLWQQLLNNKPLLIIGVHLPILLPIPNLGMIIIDEEHDSGYQEKKYPKINTKEAALLRAQIYNVPILLGSATPAIQSLYNSKTKGWNFFELKKRFAGSFPKIKIVSLTDKKQRRNFWISKELEDAIKDRLSKKEQAIIFLNRRGFSFFVQCKSCSFIFGCPSCSVSLTLHSDHQLTCHYCNFNQLIPQACPQCKALADQFLKKGIGTQQAMAILQKLFPHARIARADLDVTMKKKEWQKTVERMQQGAIDILIGTQTITKGYHFPKVTLVGILWADLNLHFPMYNASETTLQQLIQVAGRAGRQSHDSMVIVQTMSDHPVFNYLNEIDYIKFYEYEMAKRSEVLYPPTIRFAEIELRNGNETILEQEADELMSNAQAIIEKKHFSIRLLGPAKPPVFKIKNMFSRKIYLKAADINHIIQLMNQLQSQEINSSLFFTPNPLQ